MIRRTVTSSVVIPGQIWERLEPSGQWKQFEVTHLQRNPLGERVARGRCVPGGRQMIVPLRRMEQGEHDCRLVSSERVREAG